MEKIYMENNRNQKNEKRGLFNFSIVLSFVVAIFAMVSIGMAGVMLTQGTGVSYAAVIVDKFDLKLSDPIQALSEDGKGYIMELYYADEKKIDNELFCIERNLNVEEMGYQRTDKNRENNTVVSFADRVDEELATSTSTSTSTTYTLSDTPDLSNDLGLKYLLSVGQDEIKRKALVSSIEDAATAEKISGWIVQSAIWKYLATKYPKAEAFKLFKLSDDANELDDAAVINSSKVTIGRVNYTGLNVKISDLVTEANKIKEPMITVTKENDEIKKTKDDKYYQSSAISVVLSSPEAFSDYYYVSTDSEDAIIVDENGDKVGDKGISVGKKFYVRVPVEKVSEEVKKINIKVSAYHDLGSMVFYKTSDDKYQRLASVNSGSVQGTTGVEFVGSPDTGMNVVQTIYFIGLIVLLCGVGIVYANAKPVESKQ